MMYVYSHVHVCSMQYAVCSMQYAVCSMQYAVCSMQYAVCSMQYAVCSKTIVRKAAQFIPQPLFLFFTKAFSPLTLQVKYGGIKKERKLGAKKLS